MSPEPPEERYDALLARVARGAGTISLGQGIGRVLNYVTQVVLARTLGTAQLGAYVLGSTVLTVAHILAEFGMDNGVVRHVARHRAAGDEGKVRGTVLLALWSTFALGLVLALAVFFGAGFIADAIFRKPSLEPVFRAFSAGVPLFVVMSTALWATQGFREVKYAAFVQNIVRPAANLVFLGVFYLLGAQVFGAVAANVLSMAVGAVLALFYLRRVFPALLDRGTRPEFEGRAFFGDSAPMAVVNLTRWADAGAAVAVVGILASTEDVGVFNAALRTAGLSLVGYAAFTGMFSPMISGLYSQGKMEDLRALYKDVSRWVFTTGLVIFAVTAVLAPDVMAVFGEEFVAGWPVLVLLAAAQLFNSSTGPTARMLSMTGYGKTYMVTRLASAATGLAASVALTPIYGIMGAAAATAGSILLFNAASVVIVRRLLGAWPYNRHYLQPIAAGAIAAAAIYAAGLALPEGLVAILVLGPAFCLLFAALLFALGLPAGDRKIVGAAWTAARRKGGRPA